MRSSGCNNRPYSRVLGLAAAIALLSSASARADEQPHKFVLTAFTNARGGPALASGRYESADRLLHYRASLSLFDNSANSNNRCVALAATRQWEAARAACNEAVRDAEQERGELPAYRAVENEYVAIALSNRAVVHWMSSESEAATADLKRAATLSPKAAYVQRNASALEYLQMVAARVDVAAK
jgi:hypothetical protein